MGQSHVGKQARLRSLALRKLTAIVRHSKTVFLHQQSNANRNNVGNPETTPEEKLPIPILSIRLDINVSSNQDG
jgi:RecA/RadA recombinase